MQTPTKNIVFDWNGTLFDDFDALHGCTNLMLADEGLPPVEVEHFREHYNIPFERFYHGLGFSPEQVKKLMVLETSSFHDHYEPHAVKAGLRSGALEVLNFARTNKINNFILSNHLVDSIKVQLKRLSIDGFFEEVLAYADRATQFRDMTKGERLRRYREQHKISSDGMFIIGDSIEEIQIAREQNLISIAITGGCVSETRLRAEKPDYIIHNLHELLPILTDHKVAA